MIINKITCRNCNYEWYPRIFDRLPKCCPNCKVRLILSKNSIPKEQKEKGIFNQV